MGQDPGAKPRKTRPMIFVLLDAPAEALQLTGQEKAVLLALASHLNAKRNGTEVWPSLARLASLSGFSESTTRRALHKLDRDGLVKIRSDYGKSNTYTVNSEVIHSLADPFHTDRGQAGDPCHSDTPTPSTLTGDPCHTDTLTAKGTANLNSGLSPVGCSRNLTVKENPAQRKLAVHGMVAKAADAMTVQTDEQPTKEKLQRMVRM